MNELSKREYFAGLAMSALVSLTRINVDEKTLAAMARGAVQFADALLKELSK